MQTTESAPLTTVWLVTRQNAFGVFEQVGPAHPTESSALVAVRPGQLIEIAQRRYEPVFGTTASEDRPVEVAHRWD